jgi:NAD(P)-dependent dehydrogenase (short-subunit alcohol dehydrogenase family)
MGNKIALITGGSRGLGKSAALKLAQQNVDVIVTYHSKEAEALAVVAAVEAVGQRAAALQLDVGDCGSFGAFTTRVTNLLEEKWQRGNFDFLVNNAGIGIRSAFTETSEAQFDQLMNIHFKGVFFLTQHLLPIIADHGRILNVSSGLTRFAMPGMATYAAMKGAVEVLTKYLAKELGPRKITVNVLAPGAIETDFGGGMVRDNTEVNALIASGTALGRVGLPDDIGGIIAALLSDNSGWVNAQRIEASGGVFI